MELGDFFAQSAAQHPDRDALWVEGETIRYCALLARAQAIGATIDRGAGAQEPLQCGVLVGKSATGYASILGALLAGRAYVPLNPLFPVKRSARMAELAQIHTLVADAGSQQVLAELLVEVSRPLRVLLPDHDDVPEALAAVAGPHLLVPRTHMVAPMQEDLRARRRSEYAYVLFTSGSTGTPKGVGVTHANACAYVEHALARFGPGPEDRFSQFFDFTFDLSVHDLFVCWGAGACLYAASKTALLLPVSFARKHGLTFWFSVPSLAIHARRMRVSAGELPLLRSSLFCGEALPSSVAAEWLDVAPNAILENLYGPTEATIAITGFRFEREAALALGEAVVPIGVPFDDQEVCLVDSSLRVVPDGELGELCLGGTQVTPGYWMSPEATQRQFVSLRVPGKRSGWWYRTGDLAEHREGVGLLFRGRVDRQVKIRGFRVEIAECEEVLRTCGGGDAVAVIPWPVLPDGNALGVIAYGCSFRESPEVLRQRCAALLPEYMVPTELHELAALPLNVNGKVDYAELQRMREALDAPSTSGGA
jgi:D-alanine--poly(phosphoribitol) ligase subunit 1